MVSNPCTGSHAADLRAKLRDSLRLLGIVLLVLWFAFWVISIADFRFATSRMWVPRWQFLGIDFLHPYLGVHWQVQGLDPYRQYIGDFRGRYAAPPVTLALFAWTRFFGIRSATIIWIAIIALTIAYTTIACVRVRRALGLWAPPLPLALAVMLWSMPVLFSMERGNLDVWVLISLFIAMNLMRRSDTSGRWYVDVIAGLVLSVGAWAKIYSGLFIVALLPLRRWKAAVACLAGIVLIGVVWLDETRLFFQNSEQLVENRVATLREVSDWLKHPVFHAAPRTADVYPTTHSLTTAWPVLFSKTPLGTIPGLLGSGLILGATWLCAGWIIDRSPNRQRLFLPFVLWTLALGTYGLPGSYDYNLFFLLLTALCLWDWRDPIAVHVLMISVVIWWQPFAIPMPAMVFVGLKLFALIPVTTLLVRRAWEPAQMAKDSADESRGPVAPIMEKTSCPH